MTQQGLYEQIINQLIKSKLNDLDKTKFYIKEVEIDKIEASRILSQYLNERFRLALNLISGEDSIERQIEISNKIIKLLRTELNDAEDRKSVV